MFLKRLLWKIPFFKKRELAKSKMTLYEIKKDFEEGHFSTSRVNDLHNILNTSLISFSEELISKLIDRLSLYSTTSESANKLINNKIIKKSSLESTPLISLYKRDVYFSEWYSNEASIQSFISAMMRYINIDILSNQGMDITSVEIMGDIITIDDINFTESLLYRLLIEDVVNVSLFYLESQYE